MLREAEERSPKVNALIKQFTEMKKQLKMFNNPKAMKRNKLFRGLM